ncbi:NAD(P)/FAD-dependent oxidoreductase [Nocardia sp. NBC_00508]|uniref:NAD(P)-binding protein n=1 Tax=Nocardia sp. NBC_00508 TaxID=2975992 RepID=UPI002E80A8B3|nr:FAD/NAD(P)-binding protein [Nocardia sp. NBC_00508]WUD67793.1 NAD(P)/FAD-dependent oxidoreductase [Nocardia sp. NBC_00508]
MDRVCIVGAGPSGRSTARALRRLGIEYDHYERQRDVCGAATTADATFVSVRRGYHVIPKHVFDVPADVFGMRGPELPRRVERPVFQALLRLLQGDPTRLDMRAAGAGTARVA